MQIAQIPDWALSLVSSEGFLPVVKQNKINIFKLRYMAQICLGFTVNCRGSRFNTEIFISHSKATIIHYLSILILINCVIM